jgi:16S rRNA (cytosine1402-N4)-methyltransferase
VSEFVHETVLLRETVEAVLPETGRVYVDVTLGGGGHSEALLEASAPHGRVIAFDRDPRALEAAGQRLARFGDRLKLIHAPFSEIDAELGALGIERVHGVIADLGVSSPQLDEAERGFSLAREGPLDMRMDPTRGKPLLEWLEDLSVEALADAIYELGDERRSRPIARSIKAAVELGEVTTTLDLRRVIVRVTGPKRTGIDPATRTFQALRMLVNAELTELSTLLSGVAGLLEDSGRVAIISFHSGEDRLVKHAFRSDPALTPLTKRPLEASAEEQARNPRARSAKLRVAERVARGSESDDLDPTGAEP